jgi:tRNA-specific 2-thiouridylase
MKIAVLVSGGVDSSVALKLLKDQGHDVTAFYLKIWLEDELSFLGECPWDEDMKYVKDVCTQLDVPLEVVPMQKEYFDKVVGYTINEVKNGRTPNPDVMCNNNIKFGLFFDKIDDSYEKIATGHYAQVVNIEGRWYLKQAPDLIKDQTYFLANLNQEQLSRAMFPIGHLPKEKVRELAAKFNLANKDRKDSQGICFLGKLRFSDFLKHYLGTKTGDIIEFETGKKLGDHDGFWYYTIGQRRNIGLGGGPWFVVKKDTSSNIVFVSNNYFENKERDELKVHNYNWFAGQEPIANSLEVKLRHGEHKYKCILNDDKVKLDGNDQGIASGQFAVFYEGDLCLGSAIITE